MVKCGICGDEVVLPFKCPYCSGYFCYEHRLPENHQCRGLRARIYPPRLAPKAPRRELTRAYIAKPRLLSIFKMTSQTEVKHLSIGLAVFALVGFTMLIDSIPQLLLRVDLLSTMILGMLASFLAHELAHKVAAQRMGYWAEFRLSMLGLLLTIMSIALPVKIIAPGAVRVVGLQMSWENVGKISLAGPLMNMVQAIAYTAALNMTGGLLWLVLYVLATLNLSLALFNLIPFGPLDGAKIFKWSRSVWACSIVSVLAVWLSLTAVL